MLRCLCLGRPVVELDGVEIKMETRKALALLVYLCLSSGVVLREHLATMFWPEMEEWRALANLRRTLASLRKRLPSGMLEADRERVVFQKNESVWIDAVELSQCLALVEDHNHGFNIICDECLNRLKESASYYRGPFLESFNLGDTNEFDEWQENQRQHFQGLFAKALDTLSHGEMDRGDWDHSVFHAKQWVILDRLNEEANRWLMELYDQRGQRSLALRQYQELERLLVTQVGAQPEEKTKEIYENIRAQGEVVDAKANMVVAPLVKTKLYFPALPDQYVARPKLIARLEKIKEKAVMIISAPAGFGKTTILAEWIIKTALPVAWFSVDASDNNPYRFLTYLITACEGIKEKIGDATRKVMELKPLPLPQILMGSFIDDLTTLDEHIVLVLDDYQLITEKSIHEMVSFLVDHLPKYVHIIISSRTDPVIPIGRLRAQHQLLELRTNDLKFDADEAYDFYNRVMSLGVSQPSLEALEKRTEGWIAGLQIAALSIKDRPNQEEFISTFSGSNRFVLDYLLEEVLERLPKHYQEFLFSTSILERLSAPLCEAIMDEAWFRKKTVGEIKVEQQSCQEILEYLEHSNIFIYPLDEKRSWYRYHKLFSDLLRDRLNQIYPGYEKILHQRTSAWFEKSGFLEDAVRHAINSKDYEFAADVIERAFHRGASWSNGDMLTMFEWMNSIPEKVMARKWDLLQHTCRTLFAMGQFYSGEVLCKKIEKFVKSPEISKEEKEKLLPNYSATHALFTLINGDVMRTIKLTDQALSHIPVDDMAIRIPAIFTQAAAYFTDGNVVESEKIATQALEASLAMDIPYLAINSSYFIARSQIAQGKLTKALETCNHAIQLGTNGEFLNPIAGIALMTKAEISLERNLLDQAEEQMEYALKILSQGGITDDFGRGYAILALIKQSLSKKGEANSAIESSLKIAQTCNVPRITWITSAYQAKVALLQRNVGKSFEWCDTYQKREPVEYLQEFEDLTLVQILLARNEYTQSQLILDRLLPSAKSKGRMDTYIKGLVLQGLLFDRNGDGQRVVNPLMKSLSLAKEEGYRYIFQNPLIIDLLNKNLNHQTLIPYQAYIEGLLKT